jgi:hypothetical protein
MKLISLWIVLGVTSISRARVEQFGYRAALTVLWISSTRHMAGRLDPARMDLMAEEPWVSDFRDAFALDILVIINGESEFVTLPLSHPL